MRPQLIVCDPTWYFSVNQDNNMVGAVNGDANKDPADNAQWIISFCISVDCIVGVGRIVERL